MRKLDRFILASLADGQPHPYTEIWSLCQIGLKVDFSEFLKRLRRQLEYYWITRSFECPAIGGDKLKITSKGDACYRSEVIRCGGNYNYYKYFSRQVTGPRGLDHYAPLRRSSDGT